MINSISYEEIILSTFLEGKLQACNSATPYRGMIIFWKYTLITNKSRAVKGLEILLLFRFHNSRYNMVNIFLLPIIGISATLFSVSSTFPQIIKGLRTKEMDDVSIWLIITLIIGLSLWVIYWVVKSDTVIAGGNLVGVLLNLVLLVLKLKYSRKPISWASTYFVSTMFRHSSIWSNVLSAKFWRNCIYIKLKS